MFPLDPQEVKRLTARIMVGCKKGKKLNNYLINEAIIDDPAAGEVEINISDYKLNNNLTEALFQFTPSEGSEIIDLR